MMLNGYFDLFLLNYIDVRLLDIFLAEMVRPNIPDTGKRSAEHGIASLVVWIIILKVQLERTRLEDWVILGDRIVLGVVPDYQRKTQARCELP